MSTLQEFLVKTVADFANRSVARKEADVQAGIRSFLLASPLGLGEDQVVRLEVTTDDGTRRRLDIEVGQCVIEVKRDLRNPNIIHDAEDQLSGYIRTQSRSVGCNYMGILTDGATWRLYHLIQDSMVHVDSINVDSADPDVERLQVWLESILATAQSVPPSPVEIETRLGADSPSFRADQAVLRAHYQSVKRDPEVRVKRHLWAKLLRTALGTGFKDDEHLFVDHTLLVLEANIIAHAVADIDLGYGIRNPANLVNGIAFADANISNVVEADFFDWILKAPGGEEFVSNIARKLRRFTWGNVEHDVLKVLYESVIGAETRKSLGEYYTPDWLAEYIVEKTVSDPLRERVMDPACGSGTFIFHAIRRHLLQADAEGLSNGEAIESVLNHVFGMDIHPVSVVLARVTYLLAIGFDRLSGDRRSINVPIYLGDSMQWINDAASVDEKVMKIEVDTVDLAAHEAQTALFSAGRSLAFPLSTIDDPATFDRLIIELASQAQTYDTPGKPKPQIGPVLRRFGVVDSNDRQTLVETFNLLCDLNAGNENHIWGYYVRNQVRPLWFALPNRRMDVLVGNPPWVAYKYMTDAMQKQFKRFSQSRNLWAGRQISAHQDLVGLFIARCVEQYLANDGRFGFVVPKAVLSRPQYDGFRSGSWLTLMGRSDEHDVKVRAQFDEAWDLEKVKPPIFPVPAAVILGRRSEGDARRLGAETILFSGNLGRRSTDLAKARTLLHETSGSAMALSLNDSPKSPYFDSVFQGAIIAPRFLFYVTEREAGSLGVASGNVRVQSRRTTLENKPWKDLPDLSGRVERSFYHRVILGSTLVPYRLLEPWHAVLPVMNGRLLEERQINDYEGLAAWWRDAVSVWERNKGEKSKLSLMDQINYQGKLAKQLRTAKYRVVHVASGTTLAATYTSDPDVIIDNSLLWLSVHEEAAALYLTAILNSTVLLEKASRMQARGLYGARHFNKYVWHLPIPRFKSEDSRHTRLAELAVDARDVADRAAITGVRFQKARDIVRQQLAVANISAEIDDIVREIVQ